ncbi:MAG: FHA domain-containing protein FhaB/FipA [Canibacter sp.]
MSELTFLILRLGFLVILWCFVLAIVYALRSDLFGAPARRMRDRKKAEPEPMVAAAPQAPVITHVPVEPQPSAATVTDLPSAGSSGPARQLLIVSGVAEGTQLTLDEDYVTIGRSPDSTLVIVDEYTSTHHAKLQRTDNNWSITDLDSTNGTRVDGRNITGTVPLPAFTPVTIGTTTFELRP